MISINLVQAAIVAHLKAKTALTSILAANEIREDSWQGDDFNYPNVRVAMGEQHDLVTDADCNVAVQPFSVLCFSENPSSKEADTVAGVVKDILRNTSITKNGIHFSRIRCTGIIPAIRKDERTWRSEAMFQSMVTTP